MRSSLGQGVTGKGEIRYKVMRGNSGRAVTSGPGELKSHGVGEELN